MFAHRIHELIAFPQSSLGFVDKFLVARDGHLVRVIQP